MVQAARKSGRHRVRDAAIILMMFRHGLRTAELVALRWQQVDLKAGYLDVHRVDITPSGRTMPLDRHIPSCSHYSLGIPPWV
jgi:integrase